MYPRFASTLNFDVKVVYINIKIYLMIFLNLLCDIFHNPQTFYLHLIRNKNGKWNLYLVTAAPQEERQLERLIATQSTIGSKAQQVFLHTKLPAKSELI